MHGQILDHAGDRCGQGQEIGSLLGLGQLVLRLGGVAVGLCQIGQHGALELGLGL